MTHERQHIYQRHVLASVLEQTASALLFIAILGDLSGRLTWRLEGAKIIESLHYSRLHETEADVANFHMLQAAGIDPRQ